MWEDPIVKDVRRIRDEHAGRFDYDLQKIFQDLKQQEQSSGKRYTSYPPKRLESAVRRGSSRGDSEV